MKTPSSTLVNVLIGKSILETLLVGGLALFAFMTVVPPYFHGWGQETETGIAGWAVNNAALWERVEVQIFIDGKFQGQVTANESRPDVLAAGWSKDQWHGYSFSLSSLSPSYHVAHVYAVHDSGNGAQKSLQLLGDPIEIFVSPDGKLIPTPSYPYRH